MVVTQKSVDKEKIQYGEIIDMTGNDPVVRTMTAGSYQISDNKDGTIDLSVDFTSDNGKNFKALFYEIPVVWNYHLSSDGHKIIDSIDMMNWSTSVYADIEINNNSYGIFHIAINTESGQYTASGYIKNPLQIKYKTAKVSGTTVPITQEGMIVVTPGNYSKVNTSNNGIETVYYCPSGDLSPYQKTIIVKNSNDTVINDIASPMGPVRPRTYGIVELSLHPTEDSGHQEPAQIPTLLMNAHVDYAFYRSEPSRATMISDIDYYTRVNRYDDSQSRILSAIEICAHGAETPGYYDPDRTLVYYPQNGGSATVCLSVNDINTIFNTQHTDYYNSAACCIAFFHVCYGTWDNKDANGNYQNPDNPEMAHAWLDHGAYAYMSFSTEAAINIDAFESSLWHSICNYQTVQTAWNAAWSAQDPSPPGHPGTAQGQIIGNSGATLYHN
jgi:hypothetical protein